MNHKEFFEVMKPIVDESPAKKEAATLLRSLYRSDAQHIYFAINSLILSMIPEEEAMIPFLSPLHNCGLAAAILDLEISAIEGKLNDEYTKDEWCCVTYVKFWSR